jgi:indole-3-glycerol phosphate synthase
MQLFVVIEAFDAEDLARGAEAATACTRVGVDALVGLNTRDLVNLSVDRERLRRLRDSFPPDVPRVAESGLSSEQDARDVAALGYHVALVGSALMRVADPARHVAQMIAAGRQVKGSSWASA